MTKQQALEIADCMDEAFKGLMNARGRLTAVNEKTLATALIKQVDNLSTFMVDFIRKEGIVEEYKGFMKGLYGPEFLRSDRKLEPMGWT